MVSGVGAVLTNVPRVSQCADTTRIAFGFSVTDFPMALQLRVYELSSSAFIGLPCPTKNTGIFDVLLKESVIFFSSCKFMALAANGIREIPLINFLRSIDVQNYTTLNQFILI